MTATRAGLLDPPFQFRLELLPQLDGAKGAVGVDVAEVVARQRAQLAAQVDAGEVGHGLGALGQHVGGLGLCLGRSQAR